MTNDSNDKRRPRAEVRTVMTRPCGHARRRPRLWAVAGLAAVTLAACSSAAGTSAYAPPSSTAASAAAVSAAAPPPSVATGMGAASLGATTSAGGATAAPAGSATLTISEFTFATLSVKAGTVVTVVNSDPVAHTVNVNGAGIDVHVPAHGTAALTAPSKAGTYPLTCDLHPAMHGTLTVT